MVPDAGLLGSKNSHAPDEIRWKWYGYFFDHIGDQICLEGFRSVRIQAGYSKSNTVSLSEYSNHIFTMSISKGVQVCPYPSWIFKIQYRIPIRIFKSHIYDVDIQSYPIRHRWHYPYLNPNPDRNMKTNIISMIFIRIWPFSSPVLTTTMMDNEIFPKFLTSL
jgi:hypothetical protein